KIHDAAAAAQPGPGVRIEYRAATRRHQHARTDGQRIEHVPLAGAKARLAFLLEDVGDVDAGERLDLGVAVHERQAEPGRELPSDGALARSHGTHEEDVLGVEHGPKRKAAAGSLRPLILPSDGA